MPGCHEGRTVSRVQLSVSFEISAPTLEGSIVKFLLPPTKEQKKVGQLQEAQTSKRLSEEYTSNLLARILGLI